VYSEASYAASAGSENEFVSFYSQPLRIPTAAMISQIINFTAKSAK